MNKVFAIVAAALIAAVVCAATGSGVSVAGVSHSVPYCLIPHSGGIFEQCSHLLAGRWA